MAKQKLFISRSVNLFLCFPVCVWFNLLVDQKIIRVRESRSQGIVWLPWDRSRDIVWRPQELSLLTMSWYELSLTDWQKSAHIKEDLFICRRQLMYSTELIWAFADWLTKKCAHKKKTFLSVGGNWCTPDHRINERPQKAEGKNTKYALRALLGPSKYALRWAFADCLRLFWGVYEQNI